MFRASPAKASLFLLGIFSVICETLNQNLVYDRHDVELKEGNNLRCYDCNSAWDYRCGDPFDPYSIGILNCSSRKTPEHLIDHLHQDREVKPMVCRKIVQKVEGHTRVIRGCGYIEDDTDDKRCFRRTGTALVEIHYCACKKSLCNEGRSIHPTVSLALALALVPAMTAVARISTF